MSSSLAVDVVLRQRLGANYTARRLRVQIADQTRVWVDVRDRLTDAPVTGATGLAGLYWLSTLGTAETSPAQPFTLTEIEPGILAGDIPTDVPGSYRVQVSVQGPTEATAELTFDALSGTGAVPGTTTPWNDVLSAGAAAGAAGGANAAVPVASAVGAEAGAQAGADAAEPFAEAAAASEQVALDAADMALSERQLAQQARTDAGGFASLADQRAGDAEAAAAATEGDRTAAEQSALVASAAANTASTAATAALAGGNLYPDDASGLAATAEGGYFNVAGSGSVYVTTKRKVGGVAQFVQSYPSKAALDAVPVTLATQIDDYLVAFLAGGAAFGGVRDQGRAFEIAAQVLRLLADDRVRWERLTGGATLTLGADGVEVGGDRLVFEGRTDDGLLWSVQSGGASIAKLDDEGRCFSIAGQQLLLRPDGSVRWQANAGGPYLDLTPAGLISSANALAIAGLAVQAGSVPDAVLEIGYSDGYFSAFRIDPQSGALQLLGYPSIGSAAPEVGDLTPLYPTRLYLLPDRRMPLYPQQMLARRTDVKYTLTDVSSGSLSVVGREYLEIDPARVGTSGLLTVYRDDTATDERKRISLTVRVATPAAQAPRVLLIGDSITNRQTPAFVRDRLTGLGLAPEFVGTVRSGAVAAGDTDGPLAEAREGRCYSDYVYSQINGLVQPLPVGQEATYLAMTKDQQITYNPFLRAATGSDPAGIVRNGYVFDLAFYLSRFSLAAPTHMAIGLGENDIVYTPLADLPALIEDAIGIMLAQAHAAVPGLKIGIYVPGQSAGGAGETKWRNGKSQVIRSVIKAVRVYGSSLVQVIPTWAHMSPYADYTLASSTVDPLTGVVSSSVSDPVHPVGASRLQLSEPIAAWLAAES